MRWNLAVMLWLVSTVALAQESWVHADFRREGERIADACKFYNFMSVGYCAYPLFTDHPLHIAVGSLPPQNGFGMFVATVRLRRLLTFGCGNIDSLAAFLRTSAASPTAFWQSFSLASSFQRPGRRSCRRS